MSSPPTAEQPDYASAASVAGLARETEQLRRSLDALQPLAGRVEELAAVVARVLEASATGTTARPEPTPVAQSWLALATEPGPPGASGTATRAAERLLSDLEAWMTAIYLRYTDAERTLPQCWLWHPEVIEELLWLRAAWLAAHHRDAPTSAVGDWHDRQRPGVVARIRAFAGTCSLENHQSGADLHTPAPVTPLADAAPAIAAWWIIARTDPPPEPTDQQLTAAARPTRGRR